MRQSRVLAAALFLFGALSSGAAYPFADLALDAAHDEAALSSRVAASAASALPAPSPRSSRAPTALEDPGTEDDPCLIFTLLEIRATPLASEGRRPARFSPPLSLAGTSPGRAPPVIL